MSDTPPQVPSVVRNLFGTGVPSDQHNARMHAAAVELAEQRARRGKIVTDFIGYVFAMLALVLGALALVGLVALVRHIFF